MKDINIIERKVKCEGELDLAGFKLPCYVLEDGMRVLSTMGVQLALKMVDENDRQKSGSRLDENLNQKSLQPFIVNEKRPDGFKPIPCYKGGIKINGYEATVLPDICNIYLEARRNIHLSPRQKIIADQCEILVRAFAKVGIIALIDEATGYQYERERFELNKILDLLVLEDGIFSEVKRFFPLGYYKDMFGVYNIDFTPENIRRKPPFIGWLTNEL